MQAGMFARRLRMAFKLRVLGPLLAVALVASALGACSAQVAPKGNRQTVDEALRLGRDLLSEDRSPPQAGDDSGLYVSAARHSCGSAAVPGLCGG